MTFPERRAIARKMNPARHAADARADARRLREVLERLTNLSLAGQTPSTSDMQTALALARITEFHTANAERSLEPFSRSLTTQESTPCL